MLCLFFTFQNKCPDCAESGMFFRVGRGAEYPDLPCLAKFRSLFCPKGGFAEFRYYVNCTKTKKKLSRAPNVLCMISSPSLSPSLIVFSFFQCGLLTQTYSLNYGNSFSPHASALKGFIEQWSIFCGRTIKSQLSRLMLIWCQWER